MLHAALRDLQWRWRRFLIAMLGTALVFAMSLLLSGLSTAFRDQTASFVRSMGADTWLVKEGASGPLLTFAPVDAALATQVAATPGVTKADPVVYVRQTVSAGSHARDVNVFGVVPGGLGGPVVADGRGLQGRGEAVLSAKLGYRLGEQVVLRGRPFTVVGLVREHPEFVAADNVFVTLADAQQSFLGGLPLATQILAAGRPATVPASLQAFTNNEATNDLLRPLHDALRSIDLVRALLWVVAGCVVASVVFLNTLDRRRDFAVFKAVGYDSRRIAGGLALQAVLVAVSAAVVAVGLAAVLAPVFPLPVAVPTRALLALPLVAVLVGLASSLAGLRRALRVDPALAFQGP